MEITNELIDHLANLSRLEFTSEEKESFKKDFASIIGYVDLLSNVDVSNVVLERNMLDAESDLREDEILDSLSLDKVTLNTPKSMGGAIVVPTVVEEE